MKNVFVLAAFVVAMSVGFANAATEQSISTADVPYWATFVHDNPMTKVYDPNNPDVATNFYNNYVKNNLVIDTTSAPLGAYGNPEYTAPVSGWIGADGQDAGYWLIGTKFSVAGDFTIDFRAFADNNIAAVYLRGPNGNGSDLSGTNTIDGVVTGLEMQYLSGNANYGTWGLFREGTLGLTYELNFDSIEDKGVAGDWEIFFLVQNTNLSDEPSALALAVDGTVSEKSAAIPEPATMALIGLGMLGAGFAARRRNRK